MSTEREIKQLSHEWCERIGGMNVLVPIGAALNVLQTVGNQCPPEVRASMVDFLRVVANKLDAKIQ